MQLQVTGQLIGMEPRAGGWVAVVIQDPNDQYPKKLSTKQPQLLGQAQQLMLQHVTAVYTESDSQNINPNNGLPYTNRNLTHLTLANGAAPQPAQPQPAAGMQYVPQPGVVTNQPQSVTFTPQPQQPIPTFTPTPVQAPAPTPVLSQRVDYQRPKSPEETLQIHRQTATKVAAMMMSSLDKEDQNLASLLRISEQLVHYYVNGVQWNVPAPVPSPTPVGQPDLTPEADLPTPPPEDDGIPF